jgi:hypothetical protein
MTPFEEITALANAIVGPPIDDVELEHYSRLAAASIALVGGVVPSFATNTTQGVVATMSWDALKQRVAFIRLTVNSVDMEKAGIETDPFATVFGWARAKEQFKPLNSIGVTGEQVRAAHADILKMVGAADAEPANSAVLESVDVDASSLDTLYDQEREEDVEAAAGSALDFSSRRPQLLFFASHPDDRRKAVLCWRRMPDASSFIVSTHDVVSNTDVEAVVSAATADKAAADLSAKLAPLIALYGSPLVQAHIQDVESSSVISCRVVATQDASRRFFSSLSSVRHERVMLGTAQQQTIRDSIAADAERLNFSQEDVSIYPYLSEAIYGVRDYDWIIASTHFLFVKGSGAVDADRFSYLEARASMLVGSFLNIWVPSSIDDFSDLVSSSISSVGVLTTMLDVLKSTGVTVSAGVGADVETVEDAVLASDTIAKAFAAVDPETATMDPSTLLANLTSSYKMKSVSRGRVGSIDVAMDDSTNQAMLTELLASIDPLVDLTTFDGVSAFMRVLRAFYDSSSARR